MSEFKDVEGAISNIGIAYRCKPCQFDTESATEITEHIQQHRVRTMVAGISYPPFLVLLLLHIVL